ncbi:FaeA-like protein [Halogeometricum limi]|uniref:FaeA-like protein n=2 Tax=Halogeometricum limi TaxID=555875 RepID=A0A1I6HVC2_9EURY|nr:FaeA-like protein [Halogeometricum limi]
MFPLPTLEMDNPHEDGEGRDDEGKFSTKYSPEDFLSALDQLGGSGSTKEIADEVGCSRRTANYRLSDLEDEGRINSREVGRSILWQVNEDGE